jgi:hypothetical protein
VFFFVPTYEGNLQKKGWESFFEISKWTKINVQNRFFKILYEKSRFVTIIEFYRVVAKKNNSKFVTVIFYFFFAKIFAEKILLIYSNV